MKESSTRSTALDCQVLTPETSRRYSTTTNTTTTASLTSLDLTAVKKLLESREPSRGTKSHTPAVVSTLESTALA
jgi:hypothetical protein